MNAEKKMYDHECYCGRSSLKRPDQACIEIKFRLV